MESWENSTIVRTWVSIQSRIKKVSILLSNISVHFMCVGIKCYNLEKCDCCIWQFKNTANGFLIVHPVGCTVLSATELQWPNYLSGQSHEGVHSLLFVFPFPELSLSDESSKFGHSQLFSLFTPPEIKGSRCNMVCGAVTLQLECAFSLHFTL